MKEQSKAERIASELDLIEATLRTCGVIHEAAFELRRLHAENTEIKTLNDDLYRQGLAAINEKHELLDAAVKAEREACAKVVEEIDIVEFEHCMVVHQDAAKTLTNAAAAIRARNEQEQPR